MTLNRGQSVIAGLFPYDVVTAIDDAGNPTKKTNFEFYDALNYQTNEQELTIIKATLNKLL